MQPHLSPERVVSILNTVSDIKLGQELSVIEIHRLLGLMAAAANIINLGLLHETFSVLAQEHRFSST